MSASLKGILAVFGISGGILLSLAVLNFYVDPMCYYRCDQVVAERKTVNVYYQAFQSLAANPDVEQIVLGSSRGEVLSPEWMQKTTQLKTVNLSKGGAGLPLKVALLRYAASQKLPIKRVVWIADYFEFSQSSTDIKVRLTPVIRNLLLDFDLGSGTQAYLDKVQRLIDHNSVAASFAAVKEKRQFNFDLLGSGTNIDFEQCLSDQFKGKNSPEKLLKEIDISFSTFSKILNSAHDSYYLSAFEKEVRELSSKGIEVLIVIPPYHPKFMERYFKAYPLARKLQQDWEQRLFSLRDDKNVSVVSFLSGIPGDDGSPKYWNDGSHFSCRSLINMLL